MDEIRGERKAVDFGSQIRSYVLAPYQMVKDHRTNEEVGDSDGCSTATSTASSRPNSATAHPARTQPA